MKMWEGHPVLTSQSSFLPARKPGKAFLLGPGMTAARVPALVDIQGVLSIITPQAVSQAIHNDVLYWLLCQKNKESQERGKVTGVRDSLDLTPHIVLHTTIHQSPIH